MIAALLALAALLQPAAPAEKAERELLLIGRVIWPGFQPFRRCTVLAARDSSFKNQVASCPADSLGYFVLPLRPGRYFIMATVDDNDSGELDEGDGIGFYGVASLSDRPKPLDISPNAPNLFIRIPIVFQISDAGKLRPAFRGRPPANFRVRGSLIGAPASCRAWVIAFPPGGWVGLAVQASPDGRFNLLLDRGRYCLLAWADADGDGRAEPGEPAGFLADSDGKPRIVEAAGPGQLEVKIPLSGCILPGGLIKLDGARLDLRIGALPGLAQLSLSPAPRAALVMLFSDPELSTLVARAWLPDGHLLAARPATYYILVVDDRRADWGPGPGDAMGRSGGESPQGVSMPPGEVTSVAIELGAKLTREMLGAGRESSP